MKTVLLAVHDDVGQEARLQVALDVVRSVEGHLSCIEVIAAPQAVAYAPWGGIPAAAFIVDEHDKECANRARLEDRLTREGVSWDWRDTASLAASAIAEAGALADLIVLSTRLDDDSPANLRRLADHVVQQARRPVLAVPQTAKGLDLSAPVLVAWDGSREADEALRDAVPLLRHSSRVVLLDLDAADAADASAAAQYLSRHDIHAEVELGLHEAGGTVASTILKHAHGADASYIVMGAYGHSPAVETVFGGVTQAMLNTADMPLLLAH